MAVVSTITAKIHFQNALTALANAGECWTDEKRERFSREWQALEDAGAKLCDHRITGGIVQVWPSDDFTRHMAAYGVIL